MIKYNDKSGQVFFSFRKNKFFYSKILLITLLICFSLPDSYAAFQLTKSKRNSTAIIIPDHANSVVNTAAKELQYHLNSAVGIKLPIISEAKFTPKIKGGYFLGDTKMARELQLDMSRQPLNSFRLYYDKNFLYIIGRDGKGKETGISTPSGTLFGVYHYLMKSVGVRWIWPGKDGEYIPKLNSLTLNSGLDEIYRPEITLRMHNSMWRPVPTEPFRWIRRVMNISNATQVRSGNRLGHLFDTYAKKYGSLHPEWFAMLKDGTRKTNNPTSMCLSNEEFQNEIVRDWKQNCDKYWEKDPSAHFSLNLGKGDVELNCMCEPCMAMDGFDKRGPTGRYKYFKNVGDRYGKFYRNVYDKARLYDNNVTITAMAYQSAFYAPRNTKLNPNFLIYLVPDIPFPRRPEHDQWLREEYTAWYKTGARFVLRPNYFIGGYCMPEVWYDQYASEFDFIRKLGGLSGISFDGVGGMWATRGLDYYIALRLCVKPDAKTEELVDEYTGAFGAAALEIKSYFEFWRNYLRANTTRINDLHETSRLGWYFHGFAYPAYAHEIFPPSKLKKGFAYLDRATAMVKGDISASRKVEFLRKGLEHAVMTSECAKLFANPHAPAKDKRKILESLKRMRSELPPYVVDSDKLEKRMENLNWKTESILDGIPPNALLLPEMWQVKADPEDKGQGLGYYKMKFKPDGWIKASTWKGLSQQKFSNYLNVWYRTSINIPEKDSQKVVLHLGAIDESCIVWINGHRAGNFTYNAETNPNSWREPFDLDITKWVKPGSKNTICVKVEKRLKGLGGIWKPSYLIY